MLCFDNFIMVMGFIVNKDIRLILIYFGGFDDFFFYLEVDII